MANITFAIAENIAVIGNGTKGWQKEVNMVSWNGGEPKVDIRDWAPDHEKMGKGITLSNDEAQLLATALGNYFGETPAPAPAPEPTPAETPAPAPAAPETGGPQFTPEQLAIIEQAKKLMAGGK